MRLEVCGCEYFRVHVHIIASGSQQIPGLSRTFNFNFQDQNHFSWRPRPGRFTKKIPGFPGGMGTLHPLSTVIVPVWHQYWLILFADGGTRVWTTCVRLLHCCAWVGVEPATSQSQLQHSTHSTIMPARWMQETQGIFQLSSQPTFQHNRTYDYPNPNSKIRRVIQGR